MYCSNLAKVSNLYAVLWLNVRRMVCSSNCVWSESNQEYQPLQFNAFKKMQISIPIFNSPNWDSLSVISSEDNGMQQYIVCGLVWVWQFTVQYV